MAMQTITVNGIKISYSSNEVSTESLGYVLDDGLDLMTQATEAYIESGMQIKALESVGAFSTEAAPGFLKKIGAGIKAVIEKIKQFFIKIGRFIKNVFLSATLKGQAAVTYKKLKEKGIREDWRKVSVTGCGKIKTGLESIKKMSNSLSNVLKAFNKLGQKILDTKGPVTSDLDDFQPLIDAAKAYGKTKVSSKTTVGNLVFNPEDEIVKPLGMIAAFNGEIIQGLKILNQVSDLAVSTCEKYIKLTEKSSDKVAKAGVQVLRKAQEATNGAVKTYTSIAKAIIQIGKLIVKGSKKPINEKAGK